MSKLYSLTHYQTALEQHAFKVLYALDKALNTDLWKSSPFLQSIGNTLQDLRDQVALALKIEDQASVSEEPIQGLFSYVFVSLYQTQGDSLPRWQHMLANLGLFSVNRPIYLQEPDIQASILQEQGQGRHAYTVVTVAPEDILSTAEEGSQVDRRGRQCVFLKEGALKPENIIRFVHSTGEYKWINGFLVQQLNTASVTPKKGSI